MAESESRRIAGEVPPTQFLAPEYVLADMAHHGSHRINTLSAAQILILAMIGGAFITAGALFSVLLGAGVSSPGLQRLLEGLGFSAGFFFVILSGTVLFTEANVVMPATLLQCDAARLARRVTRFWALAWVGNLIGAFVLGWMIHLAQHYPEDVSVLLAELVARKMAWRDIGGPGAWFALVLSGILANWLVGMAAFFSMMGRSIVGRYVPIFLAVSLFVAANFQHSPANMGYFSLIMPSGQGPGWATALVWNIIPVGIGNVIGGSLLVVLPLWFGLTPHGRSAVHARVSADRAEAKERGGG
ncbi:MAG TPA: formate/nitrite transporter family protein [Thermoleophilia bacterium]|nr:formate/nitrite transporter family protein [Thermoleophilia bacterium]